MAVSLSARPMMPKHWPTASIRHSPPMPRWPISCCGLIDLPDRDAMMKSMNPRCHAMLQYHSAYYAIEDGWFMVRVLDFPGVISQGRSIEHARKMIKDALCLMAEYKLQQGQTLEPPRLQHRPQIKPSFQRFRPQS